MRTSLGFLVVISLVLIACTSSDELSETSSEQPIVRDSASLEPDCISVGDSDAVVPAVIGLALGEAIERVRAAGLVVIGSGTPRDDPTDDAATVMAQEPPAGAVVPIGACVAFRTRLGTASFPAVDPQPSTSDSEADVSDPHIVHVIEGLEHVESSIFAHGAVWAVTSNRPDRFSQEPVEATVVRIDPMTRVPNTVLHSPGVEPALAELDDKLWVKLVDRIVALDASGVEVASIPFAPAKLGDLTAGATHLWLLSFDAATVSVIDPSTATIVRTLDTGEFPVSPTSAFGHIWIPSSLGGTVTIIDEPTLGETTTLTAFIVDQQLEDVTPVPDGLTGAEVWTTTRNGDVFAITAHGDDFGQVRQVPIENAINRIHIYGDRAFLLPIAGRDVFVLDLETETLVTRIPTESIPFRAIVANDLVWVTGDGMAETLTVIDPQTLTVRAQFEVGSNQSNTNGPHTPVPVGDNIWVPNRGDSVFFIIDTNLISAQLASVIDEPDLTRIQRGCGTISFDDWRVDLDQYPLFEAELPQAIRSGLGVSAGANGRWLDGVVLREISSSPDRLTVLGERSTSSTDLKNFIYADMAKVDGEWVGSAWGNCDLKLQTEGWGLASVSSDPDRPAGADSTIILLRATELACASGQPPGARPVAELVEETEEVIYVAVFVQGAISSGETCPDNPAFTASIELRQPLGDRTLVDIATYPHTTLRE